jgi:hypothetical protein
MQHDEMSIGIDSLFRGADRHGGHHLPMPEGGISHQVLGSSIVNQQTTEVDITTSCQPDRGQATSLER